MKWRLYVERKVDPMGQVSYLHDWEAVVTRVLELREDEVFEFRISEYDPDGQVNLARRDLDASGGSKP